MSYVSRLKVMLSLSIEEQAKTCDMVTAMAITRGITDSFVPDLLNMLQHAPVVPPVWTLKDLIKSIQNGQSGGFDTWNSTSVGNLASLVVNAGNTEAGRLAKELLDRYKTYMSPVFEKP